MWVRFREHVFRKSKNTLNAQGDRLLRAGLPREGPLPLLAQPRDGQAVLLHLEHGPGSLRDVRDETIVFFKKSLNFVNLCRLAQDASKQAELGGLAPNPKVHLVGNEDAAPAVNLLDIPEIIDPVKKGNSAKEMVFLIFLKFLCAKQTGRWWSTSALAPDHRSWPTS